MKIYLIRHGQTTGDLEDRYGGDYDDELTQEGHVQTDELINKLKGKSVDFIFSSPKTRALQVTKKLSLALGSEYRILNDLRERNKNGVLTGLTKKEVLEKYPLLVEEVKDYRKQIRGAESFSDFVDRVNKVWHKIINSKYSSIAIVTHGGVMINVFNDILKVGLVDISDCGYAILNKTHEKISIEKMDGIKRRRN